MPGLPYLILCLVPVLRLGELILAEKNRRYLLTIGGVETGAGHYPLFFLIHGGWLLALFLTLEMNSKISGAWLAFFLAMQIARFWVILSLGRFWTTRIITVPGVPLVRRGPYRWLRHPNYLIVAGEIFALPMVFGAWQIALIFSILNGGLLAYRIRAENQALAARTPRSATAESLNQ